MPDETKLDDTQVKLYGTLVDQIQKYSTILWQFPTTLLAANAFAFDKFLALPWALLALAVVDGVLTYALYRLVRAQRAIIDASSAVEEMLRKTSYSTFIPQFKRGGVRAPPLIVYTFCLLTAALVVLSFSKLCGHAQAERPATMVGKWKAELTHTSEQVFGGQRISNSVLSMELPAKGDARYEDVQEGAKNDSIEGHWRKIDNFLIIDRQGGGLAAFRISSLQNNQIIVFGRLGQIITFNRIP